MPKDEFDFEDPFELNGMALVTQEDTTPLMAECFIEEFMRMGYGHKQVLALFRDPHYLGPHMVYEKKGEPFILELIAEVFARWGRSVSWTQLNCDSTSQSPVEPLADVTTVRAEVDTSHTDPMGAPVPKLNL